MQRGWQAREEGSTAAPGSLCASYFELFSPASLVELLSGRGVDEATQGGAYLCAALLSLILIRRKALLMKEVWLL